VFVNFFLGVSESFHLTKDTFGHIEVLINNAEIRNDKFWELETDVNLVGTQIVFKSFFVVLKF
jgi:NAD(P)-dependent dehydrogenase (short-subunit alcohol dehydrogenase family)